MDEFKFDPLSEESFDFDAIGFKTDFINAFNSVQCNIFLQECAQKFPQIYKWVCFCFSQHSLLFFGDYTISSEAGVQQGDPLGPFCFAWFCKNLFSKSVFKFLTSDYILGTWMMEVFLVIHGMF